MVKLVRKAQIENSLEKSLIDEMNTSIFKKMELRYNFDRFKPDKEVIISVDKLNISKGCLKLDDDYDKNSSRDSFA